MKTFALEIITQEKHIASETVSSLTVDTESGQITVLADHIPLFTKLVPCELKYLNTKGENYILITGGFLDVSLDGVATILADSAIRSEEINLSKIKEAATRAKEQMKLSSAQSDSLKMEFELRQALIYEQITTKKKNRP